MEMTTTDTARHYAACMDSVDLINGIFEGTSPSEDPLGTVTSNQAHLLGMLEKDYWTDEDLSPIKTAADRATDGVNFPTYVDLDQGPRTTGTAREFMDLFTPTEKLAIVNLSMVNAEIKLWYDEALAGDVWLGHANVTSGLLAMQYAGVITAERGAEILATDFDA